ncbi:MAG TPA: NAD-dependent epimerase/dehydratase family protein [Verrucomicrobiae bacterium]|nr:NAD-dependent epimerase/dehydratase family protein [Verrucomicrobiae bacterium]
MERTHVRCYTFEMGEKKICAITGSNGYVGGCVKNYCAARGREILEVTRRPAPGARAVPFRLGAEISPRALAEAGALVHCAYDFQPLRREEIRAVNVDGTRKLFQAARAAGVGKIVCISSISAYDGCRSLYGQAKLEIEKIALDHGALVIRPGLVYGSAPGGMFGKLVAQVRKSSVIPLIGDGSQTQFLVHQEDLAAFIEKFIAGKIEIPPRVLTAANEQPWPFRQLLLEIARGLNKKVKFVPLPWRLLWAGLKTVETCGLRLNFRSDSLVSLMYQNANPDFSPNAAAGLICRPFEVQKLDL